MPIELTERQKESLNYLYEKGMPLEHIAGILKTNYEDIKKIIKKKIKDRNSSLRRLNKIQIRLLKKLYCEYHVSLVDLSRFLSIDKSNLLPFLYNITTKEERQIRNNTINRLNNIKAVEKIKKSQEKHIQEWIKLDQEGITRSEISRMYGLSKTRVSEVLRSHGYKKMEKYIKENKEKVNQILEYGKHGYYIRAIAAKVHIPPKRVSLILHKEFPDYFRIRFGGHHG